MTQFATTELSRRTLLAVLGGLMGGSAFTRSSADAAQDEPSQAYTPAGMKRTLPETALQEPLARIRQNGPFDLDDSRGLTMARLKAMFSMNGDYTYTAFMTRHFVVPIDRTPYALVNELELNVTFLTTGGPEFQDDYEQGKLMLHALYTRVFLDAHDLRPVQTIDVPAMNKQLTLKNTQFALSIPMDLNPSAEGGDSLGDELTWYPFGDDLHISSQAIPPVNAARPPRIDTSVWRVNLAHLMDPGHMRLKADYSYCASFYAAVYGWTGLSIDDPTRVLTSKNGIKVHTLDELPALVRERILSKYPERVPQA
ncbi:hypothetical protein [Candidatus Foliamicus sp.]